MERTILLSMGRTMGFTHEQFAKELGVSVRSFERYVIGGVPLKIMNAANWVYYREMGKPYPINKY